MPRTQSTVVLPSLCIFALSGCLQSRSDTGTAGGTNGTTDETDTIGETDTTGGTDTLSETDTSDGGLTSGMVGTEVGDTIADMVFFRGNGDALALSSYAGQEPPALIIFGTASW